MFRHAAAAMAHVTEIAHIAQPPEQAAELNDAQNAAQQAQAAGAQAATAQKQVTKDLAGAQPQSGAAPSTQPGDQAQSNKDALAGREDQIANALRHAADALAGDHHTAEAFAAAAGAAGTTAESIRAGQNAQAQAQSTQTEKAIAQAIRIAAAAAGTTLDGLVHDLELRVADLTDRQTANLTDLEDLRKPSLGGEADRSDRSRRIAGVAVREAQFKQEIEDLQHELEDLTVPSGGTPDRADEHAAREDLGRALQSLVTAGTRQDAIDATMDVRGGQFPEAAQSMAKVHQGLEEAHAQITAAAAALGAAQSQIERDYRSLQRVSSGLRQIVNTAQSFTVSGGPASLPAAVAPILDASEQRLHRDLLDTVGRATATPMAGLAQVRDLAQKPLDLQRDLSGSLDQLRALIQSLETLEGQLAAAIDSQQQRAATRDFLKDPIPPAYQKRVSAYFQALSRQ
jgi:hypothetical protein